MERVLRCDGIFVEKLNKDGKGEAVTPADLCERKAYVDANRTLRTPFDIVVTGKTTGLDRAQAQDKLIPRREAGATWWVEDFFGGKEEEVIEHIRQGPPRLD